MDSEVVEAVVVAKDGRVGACIDICLEMSSGIQTPIEQPPLNPQSTENANRKSSEENGDRDQGDTTDLLGLDEEHGVAGINLQDTGHGDRPGQGGYVDLMS